MSESSNKLKATYKEEVSNLKRILKEKDARDLSNMKKIIELKELIKILEVVMDTNLEHSKKVTKAIFLCITEQIEKSVAWNCTENFKILVSPIIAKIANATTTFVAENFS